MHAACPVLTHLNLEKSTSYEAPHYAVFPNLMSLQISSVQIFSSAPYYQIISFYIPPLMSEIMFHTHTELEAKLYFCIF
jgi:hypothetical protein